MARLQVGFEFFREIREHELWYADKTGFIEEFLTPSFSRISLITRPRRFGKTLMLTMLRDFFDISQDSKAIFDGLAISKNKALCDSWMNQYPAVFVTFHGIEGLSFEEALGKFRSRIAEVCDAFKFLTDSTSLDERDRAKLALLKQDQGDEMLMSDSMSILCRALHAHYGRPAILLIDEYDVPLAKAHEHGYYPEMVQFCRRLLSTVLKTSFLKFAILAGCLRLSGEYLFESHSGYTFYDVTQARFADKIGFTSEEVDYLLASAGLSEKKDVIEEWYGGYRFGDDAEMYCPWNILQYIEDLHANPAARPKRYWGYTSGNDVVCSAVAHSNEKHVRDSLDSLMAGGCIAARLTKNLTHDCLYDSLESIWTLLLSAGYLTRAGSARMTKCRLHPGKDASVLAIPNREVLKIYASVISDWFRKSVQDTDWTEFFQAFWADDADGVAEFLCDKLDNAICCCDARQNFYHDFVKWIFSCTGWEVASEIEYGRGRADIEVLDIEKSRAAFIQLRQARSKRGMPGMAEKALCRIKKKEFAADLLCADWEVSFWGMAFFKKACIARAEEGAAHP